ncbi:MAG: TetR/AcrR family transcriptional regulator [Rhodospirillales bacterium]|nr:MAG: TetR/AcrR family transcriptional regulator [Rhodospirillales bacterium]
MARPRSFDFDEALTAATRVFLAHGFDGATLDDLTGAMGINKPSLYAAFGDKEALYARVLEGYAAMAKSVMESALDAGDTLEHAGQRLLSGAIEVYAPAKGDHLGCLIATTATTAAGSNPAVRAALSAFLSDVDQLIRAAIKRRFGGELAEGSVAAAADVLSAAMYSIAIRARAGASRRQLSAIAERAVATMGMIARTRA